MKLNLIAGSLMMGLLAVNSVAKAADVSGVEKKQIEGVVHEYLIQNPDVVVQSLQIYQEKQMQQAQKTIEKTQASSAKYANALFHTPNDPSAGNPNGKLTVVEFFDYQCPHCVDMTPVIEDLIKNNNDVKVIFKEFPIRGAMSEFSAKAALAANLQGKYFEFHKGLMEVKQQPLTQAAVYAIAKTVGLNVDKLKTDMNGSVVDKQVKANYKTARDLQLMGTPAFFIAKSTVSDKSPATAVAFVPGQVDKNQLNDIIQKIAK
jgi:protein-disulfide isomerase